MAYMLFIDDERFPPASWCEKQTVICRTSEEAINYIWKHGLPAFISFDHDLGGDDTSIKVINWIENRCIEGCFKFNEDFAFYVHSQNPVGAENIRYRMEALIKYFGESK